MSQQPPGTSSAGAGVRRPYITCREVLEFVMSYLDGDLTVEQRHEFERHIGVCPSCVNYLDTYKTTIMLGKSAMCDADSSICGDIPDALIKAVRAARLKGL